MSSSSKASAVIGLVVRMLAATVGACLVVGPLSAQPWSPYIAGELAGRRGVATARSGRLQWRSGAEVDWSVSLPFDTLTSGAIVAGDIVVSGFTPEAAMIARVVVRDGLVVAETVRTDPRRIGAVAYDAINDQVFLADFVTGGVYRYGRGASLPAPGDWQLVATIPNAHRRMYADVARGGLIVGNKWIHRVGDRWTIEVMPPEPDLIPRLRSPRSTTGPLRVSTAGKGRVTLVEEQGPQILLGDATGGTRDFSLPAGTALDLRKRYRLAFEQDGRVYQGSWFAPEWRQGSVAKSGGVVSVQACEIDLAKAFVGSNLLSVTASAELVAPHTAVEWVAWCHVVDAHAPAPVDVVDGVTLLRPAAGLRLPGDSGEAMSVRGSLPVPLTAHGGQAGKIVYVQYLVLVEQAGGEGVGFSDVAGGMIRREGGASDMESSRLLAAPTAQFWREYGVDAGVIRARIARARELLRR